jgi:hypothetical protein
MPIVETHVIPIVQNHENHSVVEHAKHRPLCPFMPIHAHSEFWCRFGNFGSPYQAPANSSWAQWHVALFYLFLVPLLKGGTRESLLGCT